MRFKAVVAIVSISLCMLTAAAQQAPRRDAAAFGDTEYKLGPEDKIQVFVWKEADVSTTVVVRPDGKVSLPLIGEMPASGKTALQLQNEITQKLTQFYSEPTVNVMVVEVNSAKVSVLGEVKNPNMYRIQNKATVLDAVALAGGFTEYAKRDKVSVLRTMPTGEQKTIKVNVEQMIKKGDLFYVLPNDKIYVQ